MPIIDPKTGKRLSGAAQRKLRAQRLVPADSNEADPPAKAAVHPLLAAIPAPPIGDINTVESWATRAAFAVTIAGREGEDPDRLRVVRKALRAVGQLRDKARRSFKATELLKIRFGESFDLISEVPPASPIPGAAWAYFRVAVLAHQAMTARNPHPLADQIEDMATIGFVPAKGAIDELTASLRGK